MKIFAVYLKNSEENIIENAVFVKQGFSLYAAFFQTLWTLYKKMWLTSFFIFAASIFIALLENKGYISELQSLAVNIGLILFVGHSAIDWYEKNLQSKGYSFCGVVAARDYDEARKIFAEKFFQQGITKFPTLKAL